MGREFSLFIEESKDEIDSWNIQFGIEGITVNLHASSLLFLYETFEFIKETFNNPKYRDEEIEPSKFHRKPTKSCDLSSHFNIPVSITKDGEYDDSYIVYLSLNNDTWVYFDLRGEVVTALLDEFEIAIEVWL